MPHSSRRLRQACDCITDSSTCHCSLQEYTLHSCESGCFVHKAMRIAAAHNSPNATSSSCNFEISAGIAHTLMRKASNCKCLSGSTEDRNPTIDGARSSKHYPDVGTSPLQSPSRSGPKLFPNGEEHRALPVQPHGQKRMKRRHSAPQFPMPPSDHTTQQVPKTSPSQSEVSLLCLGNLRGSK